MSSSKNHVKHMETLEDEILKTIQIRREYTAKIMQNYKKSLDLKFENLKNSKFVVDDDSADEKFEKIEGSQNITGLIVEPRKLRVALVKDINDKRKNIQQAFQILKRIEASRVPAAGD